MPLVRSYVTLILPIFASGCLILPVPNRSLDAWGVESSVVDATTGLPIPDAVVRDVHNERVRVRSGSDGRFRLEPIYQWHAGYLFGVLSYPIWPYTGDLRFQFRSICVSTAGYPDQRFTIQAGAMERSSAGILRAEPVNDLLVVQIVPLVHQSTAETQAGCGR